MDFWEQTSSWLRPGTTREVLQIGHGSRWLPGGLILGKIFELFIHIRRRRIRLIVRGEDENNDRGHLRFAHATVRWVNTVSAGSTCGQSTLKFALRGFSRSVREFEQEPIRLVILMKTRNYGKSIGNNRLSVAALSAKLLASVPGCARPMCSGTAGHIGHFLREESSYRKTVTTVRFVVTSSFH